MKDALRDGIKAGLVLKRTAPTWARTLSPDSPARDNPIWLTLIDEFVTKVGEATILAVEADKIDPFYHDGLRRLENDERNLPLTPAVIVSCGPKGPVNMVLCYTSEDGSLRCISPEWSGAAFLAGFAMPLGVFEFRDGGGFNPFLVPCFPSYRPTVAVYVRDTIACLVGATAAGAVGLHRPARTLSLDRARRKIGTGAPVRVDYRICEIEAGRETASIPQGGTHNSPRWHVRRGHYRKLADGRLVFVRQCEVGSKEHGSVIKDYAI